eukprot:8417438-Pyramimonas_sp.AAC.1
MCSVPAAAPRGRGGLRQQQERERVERCRSRSRSPPPQPMSYSPLGTELLLDWAWGQTSAVRTCELARAGVRELEQ